MKSRGFFSLTNQDVDGVTRGKIAPLLFFDWQKKTSSAVEFWRNVYVVRGCR